VGGTISPTLIILLYKYLSSLELVLFLFFHSFIFIGTYIYLVRTWETVSCAVYWHEDGLG
jgi:hypothetical protein